MIPTFFTTLALGTITSMVASIMALSSWIAGSSILQGNLFFDTTNNTNPGIYVNTTKVMALTGAGLSFQTTGTQTGVVLKSGNTTELQIWDTACTNTGGLTKYPTCYVPNPFGSTGALVAANLECGNTNADLRMSGGLVKSRTQAVGTIFDAFGNMNDMVIGTGTTKRAAVNTGATLTDWNGADGIKIQLATLPAGGIDCKVHVSAYDRYGE